MEDVRFPALVFYKRKPDGGFSGMPGRFSRKNVFRKAQSIGKPDPIVLFSI
jgi:hypothetical protein